MIYGGGVSPRLALTQAEVAERMGVSKGRAGQIEHGEISTVDVLSRYVRALGGELRLVADFKDETVLVARMTFCVVPRIAPLPC